VPVTGKRFGGNVGEIGRNLWLQSTAKFISAQGDGLK